MNAPRTITWAGVPLEIERTRICRCGQKVDLGFSKKDRVPFVSHLEPVCTAFRDLSAGDFLVWNGWVQE